MTSGAGRVLGGRYTLLTPIAQGGMGEVWKARDRVSGHIVAAKVLRPELAGEELSLSRLRLEARNSMSISHPNIANTQDSGQEDGIGWIIMELVDGYPLTDYLRGGSRIEPEYLMPILIQVAMALGAAARAGVVHRDIKPANILVRPDGMVKLTDFGISRARDQVNLTAAGMVMGTAQYLPPEQAMGEIATPTGDLYALGVIAYEAAAGRRPFTGETQVDIAFAHVNDPVPPLPDFVPEPLADVILHLLEKDPAKRPESGSAAVREIAAAAKAMGISVTPRPLPLPKAAQRPTEVRTPVQPSVPILAPVRHLTRRTLPDEMLQPPSGLNPRVRSVTGRHAVVPRIIDEATTIAPSSSMIPITGRHVTVPRIIDEAPPPPVAPPPVAPPPVARPVSAPIRTRRQRPDATGEQAPVVGSTRSLTSTGRHAAVPPAPQRPTSTSTPSRADSTPAAAPVERPQAMVPAQATTASSETDTIPTPPTTTGTQTPIDRRAALNERLRQRAANRQAEDAAEEQRRAQVAREEQERQRELREAREARQRKEARQRHDAEQAYRHASRAPVPQPTRDTQENAAKDTTASSQTSTSTGSTPRVLGTVPQPRAKKKSSTASTRPRRSVFEPRSEKKTRRPKWHELDARSAEQKRPAAKTAYSRSVVAPPVPTVKKVIRWVVVTLIVIALIALAAVTIRHMLSSLIQSNAGATITEEVRTWHSPWPTV